MTAELPLRPGAGRDGAPARGVERARGSRRRTRSAPAGNGDAFAAVLQGAVARETAPPPGAPPAGAARPERTSDEATAGPSAADPAARAPGAGETSPAARATEKSADETAAPGGAERQAAPGHELRGESELLEASASSPDVGAQDGSVSDPGDILSAPKADAPPAAEQTAPSSVTVAGSADGEPSPMPEAAELAPASGFLEARSGATPAPASHPSGVSNETPSPAGGSASSGDMEPAPRDSAEAKRREDGERDAARSAPGRTAGALAALASRGETAGAQGHAEPASPSLDPPAVAGPQAAPEPEAGARGSAGERDLALPLTPAESRRLAAELAQAARDHAATGRGELAFRIRPPELGTLRLRLSVTGETARIEVIAQTREALHLFRAQASHLSDQLRDQGVNLAGLHLTLAGDGGAAGDTAWSERRSAPSGGGGEPDALNPLADRRDRSPPPARSRSAGALDLLA